MFVCLFTHFQGCNFSITSGLPCLSSRSECTKKSIVLRGVSSNICSTSDRALSLTAPSFCPRIARSHTKEKLSWPVLKLTCRSGARDETKPAPTFSLLNLVHLKLLQTPNPSSRYSSEIPTSRCRYREMMKRAIAIPPPLRPPLANLINTRVAYGDRRINSILPVFSSALWTVNNASPAQVIFASRARALSTCSAESAQHARKSSFLPDWARFGTQNDAKHPAVSTGEG